MTGSSVSYSQVSKLHVCSSVITLIFQAPPQTHGKTASQNRKQTCSLPTMWIHFRKQLFVFTVRETTHASYSEMNQVEIKLGAVMWVCGVQVSLLDRALYLHLITCSFTSITTDKGNVYAEGTVTLTCHITCLQKVICDDKDTAETIHSVLKRCLSKYHSNISNICALTVLRISSEQTVRQKLWREQSCTHRSASDVNMHSEPIEKYLSTSQGADELNLN